MTLLTRPSALRCVFQLLVLAYAASALPLQNITLPLPVGTTNHETPGLLCTPTKWIDIALFYLFNYVAHAATVLTRPGERSDDFLVSVIGGLLLPALGLYRGIEAIMSGAVFVKNDDLRKAARSGALCMLVRGQNWKPADGDEVSNAVFRREKREQTELVTIGSSTTILCSEESASTKETSLHVFTYSPPWLNSKFGHPLYVHRQIIHGTYELPEGYRFAFVPSEIQFTARSSPNSIIEVSATYNLVKALVALVQSMYALTTLYRSRGDQINQFGFAAFGLTVAPYAVMSIMNLIGNLCRPDYASLYIVENSIMDEARRRGGVFEGSVARVTEETSTVCGCGLDDGEDAENLRFLANEKGGTSATFGVARPPGPLEPYSSACPVPEPPGGWEEAYAACPALTQHSHSVEPLPKNMDYTGTEEDALLLVPCCNPIQQRPRRPSQLDIPSRPWISKLALRKIYLSWRPSSKRLYWSPSFAASATSRRSLYYRIAKYLITTTIALTPVAVNGAMSHFQTGSLVDSSSPNWKAYTLQWLLIGVFTGILWVLDQEAKDASLNRTDQVGPVLRALLYVISASPAVGGYVVVGQMLRRYGVCIWVGD